MTFALLEGCLDTRVEPEYDEVVRTEMPGCCLDHRIKHAGDEVVRTE